MQVLMLIFNVLGQFIMNVKAEGPKRRSFIALKLNV